MLQELEHRLDFKAELINPVDLGGYSKVDEATGQWTGQIRQLIIGEADMAFGDFLNGFWRPQVYAFDLYFHQFEFSTILL